MNELIDTMVILIDYAIFIIQIHDITEQNSELGEFPDLLNTSLSGPRFQNTHKNVRENLSLKPSSSNLADLTLESCH